MLAQGPKAPPDREADAHLVLARSVQLHRVSARIPARLVEELIMSRRTTRSFALASVAAVTMLVAACSHQPDGSGVTTVTSGPAPAGVKMTAARSDRDEAAMRLADELCARAAACNQIGEGARYRSEEACMADEGAKAPAQIGAWTCTPTRTQAGFEECLAAIRSERCETALPRADRLIACRTAQVCGR